MNLIPAPYHIKGAVAIRERRLVQPMWMRALIA